MKRGILVIATGVLLGSAAWSSAEVNCKQVNKYLQTGRSVQDVAETMVIGESEVKKCQEQAGDAAKAAQPAGEKGAQPGQEGMAK
jgi:hypothetical protein